MEKQSEKQSKQLTYQTGQRSPEDPLYLTGIGLLVLAPAAFYIYRRLVADCVIFRLPCLLHTVTGYYCPGCGGRRAVDALLRLSVVQSFLYHPLVPYTALLYVWFMLSQSVERLSARRLRIGLKWHPIWLWLALALLLLHTIVPNVVLYLGGTDLLKAVGG